LSLEMSNFVQKKIIVQGKQGLHARPAALFVQLANKFDSQVTLEKDNEKVNGKSIMGILMLAAEKGAEITITVEGDDAQQALDALEGLITKEDE